MPTIRDVAKAAGVSIATVSRVFNRTGHPVKETTRARVFAAVKELDYRPNAVAKNLSKRRAQSIGVVIPDISNPYYAEIVRGIQDGAEESGYTAMLQNTDLSVRKAVNAVLMFREQLADGVIFVGGLLPKKEIREAMGKEAIIGVALGRQDLDVPSIQIDNSAATADAVRHLVSRGRSRIAFFGGPQDSHTMQDRYTGLEAGMKTHKLAVSSELINWGQLSLEQGYSRMKQMLNSVPLCPDALVAGNDRTAIGAIRAVEEYGLRVPEDIAVVGFDNIELAEYFSPPLTTIDIPRYQMGDTAMKLLLSLIRGRTVPPITWLSTRLIVRRSS